MSWLGGSFFFDVVVSVDTPQITSSRGIPQLEDKRNNDHRFFPTKQHEARRKTEEGTTQKTFAVISWRDVQQNVPLHIWENRI